MIFNKLVSKINDFKNHMINIKCLSMLLFLFMASIALAEENIDGEQLTWHSYNVEISDEYSVATVRSDDKSFSADIVFYISQNDNGIIYGTLLNYFRSPFEWAKMNQTWLMGGHEKDLAPYIGISSEERGKNILEKSGPVPEPLGVYDLKMHPPMHDQMMVAAFIAPVPGDYNVSDLAVRKDDEWGDPIRYTIINSNNEKIFEMKSGTNGQWSISDEKVKIGYLNKNDVIYFAVHRYKTWAMDKGVISWTINCNKQTKNILSSVDEENSFLLTLDIRDKSVCSENKNLTISRDTNTYQIEYNNKSVAVIYLEKSYNCSIHPLRDLTVINFYNIARQQIFAAIDISAEEQYININFLTKDIYYVEVKF